MSEKLAAHWLAPPQTTKSDGVARLSSQPAQRALLTYAQRAVLDV